MARTGGDRGRATLRRILLTGLDDVVHLGKEFQRYEQHSDGTVTAFFADGTSAHTARAFFRLCGKVDPLRRAVFDDS